MIRNILVPLDGSAFGEQALPRALAVARRHGATVHLVHVHGLPMLPLSMEGTGTFDAAWSERQRADEAEYLERVATERVRPHADTRVRLLDAPVVDALSRYIEASAIDLVVMTTHGRGGISRVWLGSVADELVRATHAPLLLLRPVEGNDVAAAAPLRVLVPLDGSTLAEAAIEPALAIMADDAELVLLHVVPPMFVAGAPYGAPAATFDAGAHRAEELRAERYLGAIADRLRGRVQNVLTRVLVHPQPAHALREATRALGTDLTALATHGRSGVARWALGSVADKLIRAGDTPVLVVRPRASGAARDELASGEVIAVP